MAVPDYAYGSFRARLRVPFAPEDLHTILSEKPQIPGKRKTDLAFLFIPFLSAMPQIFVELSGDLRKQTFYSKAFILTFMRVLEVYINLNLVFGMEKKSVVARSYSHHIT